MVNHRVRHLPVMDGTALDGVLSDRDLKPALDPDLGLAAEGRIIQSPRAAASWGFYGDRCLPCVRHAIDISEGSGDAVA
jgi:hypothetical protein